MSELQEWLEGCGCVCVPVEVTIGRTTYEGVRYKQTRKVLEGCRAYTEGEREYVQEALYLLGDLPATYRRSRRIAFLIDGEEHEWYLASWVTDATAKSERYGMFHFEGHAAFQIMPWSVGGKIDEHEERPYRRVAIRVAEPVA
jgi:hypothetical protein